MKTLEVLYAEIMGNEDLQEMIGGSILTDTVGCTKRDSCGCSNTCIEACC